MLKKYLLTTAASVLNQEVAFLQAWAPATAAGTYYVWLGRAGHLAVKATGAANGFGETTATAGTVNFAATPTVGTKSITPTSLYVASFTFTANTTNGSPYLTNVSSIADLALGAAIAAQYKQIADKDVPAMNALLKQNGLAVAITAESRVP